MWVSLVINRNRQRGIFKRERVKKCFKCVSSQPLLNGQNRQNVLSFFINHWRVEEWALDLIESHLVGWLIFWWFQKGKHLEIASRSGSSIGLDRLWCGSTGLKWTHDRHNVWALMTADVHFRLIKTILKRAAHDYIWFLHPANHISHSNPKFFPFPVTGRTAMSNKLRVQKRFTDLDRLRLTLVRLPLFELLSRKTWERSAHGAERYRAEEKKTKHCISSQDWISL